MSKQDQIFCARVGNFVWRALGTIMRVYAGGSRGNIELKWLVATTWLHSSPFNNFLPITNKFL